MKSPPIGHLSRVWGKTDLQIPWSSRYQRHDTPPPGARGTAIRDPIVGGNASKNLMVRVIHDINALGTPAHGPVAPTELMPHGRASALDWILKLQCLFLFVWWVFWELSVPPVALESGVGATETRLNLLALNQLPLRFSSSLVRV